MYYETFGEHSWVVLAIILAIVPVVFLHMNLIADQWMAISMRKLAKRLHFSPAIAAVTITSFAAGAPDLMSIVNNADRPEGSHIGVGLLLGSFLFCTTLVIANVLFSSLSNIKMERYPLVKEMSFYLAAIFLIVIFGLYGKINYFFIGLLMAMYVSYILLTIKIDRMKPDENQLFEQEEEQEELIIMRGTAEYQEHYDIRSRAGSVVDKAWDELLSDLYREIIDDRKTVFGNVICAPLALLGVLVLPYSRNPLVKTGYRYVLYLASSFLLMDSMFYYLMSKGSTFGIGVFIAVLFSFLDVTKISKNTLKFFCIFMTLACSIMVLKIYVLGVLDCVIFLSFFYSVDDLIISALLLSAGDSMGDLFSNSALAHQGEIAMASLACFANQNFNMMLGLSANLLVNLQRGITEFDIFGIRRGPDGLMMRNWFMIVLIAFCVTNIGIHWSHYIKNNFHLEKSFARFLVWEYIGFFGVAIVLGVISHIWEF